MSRFLDLSIERNTKKGWQHFYDASYTEGMELINCYALRDVFSDTDCYDCLALQQMPELTDETILNIGIKIEEGLLTQIHVDSPLYPYKFRRVDNVINDNLSKDEILEELEKMMHSIQTRFNDVIILIKPENVDDVINTSLKITQVGLRFGIKLDGPYAATQAFKYQALNDWFDGLTYCSYLNDNNEEVKQYTMPAEAKVSSYKDLLAMKSIIEKDIIRAKEAINDEARLSRLLKQQTSGVLDDDWNTSLGHIIKSLIDNDDSDFSEYAVNDIEELENQKAELDKLILITGENGRVIWSIS